MTRRSRLAALSVVSVLAVAAGGCTPLPPEPALGGPSTSVTTTSADSPNGGALREIVWMRGRTMVRITRGDRMCHEASASSGCVQLSATDRRELDRFFSDTTFRQRFTSYKPCPAPLGVDTHVFGVTYVDGQRVARLLDAPIGTPMATQCDRATRDALVAIEDKLVDRYMR